MGNKNSMNQGIPGCSYAQNNMASNANPTGSMVNNVGSTNPFPSYYTHKNREHLGQNGKECQRNFISGEQNMKGTCYCPASRSKLKSNINAISPNGSAVNPNQMVMRSNVGTINNPNVAGSALPHHTSAIASCVNNPNPMGSLAQQGSLINNNMPNKASAIASCVNNPNPMGSLAQQGSLINNNMPNKANLNVLNSVANSRNNFGSIHNPNVAGSAFPNHASAVASCVNNPNPMGSLAQQGSLINNNMPNQANLNVLNSVTNPPNNLSVLNSTHPNSQGSRVNPSRIGSIANPNIQGNIVPHSSHINQIPGSTAINSNNNNFNINIPKVHTSDIRHYNPTVNPNIRQPNNYVGPKFPADNIAVYNNHTSFINPNDFNHRSMNVISCPTQDTSPYMPNSIFKK